MRYEKALETAEKVLTQGASLSELVETRNNLRAVTPGSELAALLEERIATMLKEQRTYRPSEDGADQP